MIIKKGYIKFEENLTRADLVTLLRQLFREQLNRSFKIDVAPVNIGVDFDHDNGIKIRYEMEEGSR